MTLNRYAKSRDINEPQIVQALRAVGASVTQLDKPVDLLVGYRGRTYLMEVKQPGERKRKGGHRYTLTPDQKDFYATWKGGDLMTVRTTDQALACIGITNRGVEIGDRVEVGR